MEHSNKAKFIDRKIMGRPSMVKGASYASMLRSPVMLLDEGRSIVKRKGIALIGDKGCQVSSGMCLCRVFKGGRSEGGSFRLSELNC